MQPSPNHASYELSSFQRVCCAYRHALAVVTVLFWFGLLSLPIFQHLEPRLTTAIAAAVGLLFASIIVSSVGAYGVQKKYRLAVAHDDVVQMRKLARILHGDPTPRNLMARFGEAHALIAEENYGEARDMYAELQRKRLRPQFRTFVINNLAFTTSMAGDTKAGIKLAHQAVELAKQRSPRRQRDLDIFFGTLGVALALGGEHEEAIDFLTQVTKRPGDSDHQALRGYFLGTSLLALKRNDEALVALQEASKQTGKWAERARTVYAKALAQPHRA